MLCKKNEIAYFRQTKVMQRGGLSAISILMYVTHVCVMLSKLVYTSNETLCVLRAAHRLPRDHADGAVVLPGRPALCPLAGCRAVPVTDP